MGKIAIFLYIILFSLTIFGAKIVSKVEKPKVTVDVVDVGQGDGVVIRDHETGKVVLIDAGKRSGEIVRFLEKKGIKTINLFILTHAHSDHIGSASKIIKKFKVKKVLDAGYTHTSKMYRKLLELIDEKKVPYVLARSGQNINMGSGKVLKILSPSVDFFNGTRSDVNSNGVIVQLIVNDAKFFFAADAEEETEEFILEHHSGIKSDVLKIAHHGGRHSTTDRFLNKVSPKIAVISVAERNVYNHPSPETLEKLKNKDITTYLTSKHGTVSIDTDGESIAVNKTKSQSNSEDVRKEIVVIKENDPDNYEDAEVNGLPAKLNKSGDPIYREGYFYASKKSTKFYASYCKGVKRISPKNLVEYSKIEYAIQSGKELAKRCKLTGKARSFKKISSVPPGKIDINTASVSILSTIKGIGRKTARKIIKYREQNGPFRTIEQIKRVKGIGPKRFEKIRSKIIILGVK